MRKLILITIYTDFSLYPAHVSLIPSDLFENWKINKYN